MPTFQKRSGKWRAIIRRKGAPETSKTFATKTMAEAWARKIEHGIDSGQVTAVAKGTVGELFRRYRDEVTPDKKGARWEMVRLNRLERELGDVLLKDDLIGAVQDWRDERLKSVKGSSVNRELNLISAVFSHARKEWRMPVLNPVREIKRPKNPRGRSRRISEAEQVVLVEQWGLVPPETVTQYIPWVFEFALETAMRLGEILALEWTDVHERWVVLEKTKNGEGRVVPLSQKARSILDRMPRGGARVFPIHPGTFDTMWRRVRPAGMVFHDTRRTALSRMAKKVPVEVLAKISGHRDMKVLLNTYYRPTPEELVAALDGPPATP
jgi:integrase